MSPMDTIEINRLSRFAALRIFPVFNITRSSLVMGVTSFGGMRGSLGVAARGLSELLWRLLSLLSVRRRRHTASIADRIAGFAVFFWLALKLVT
jgi:hypothetical protein